MQRIIRRNKRPTAFLRRRLSAFDVADVAGGLRDVGGDHVQTGHDEDAVVSPVDHGHGRAPGLARLHFQILDSRQRC